MGTARLKIADIIIGDRSRKDLGDLQSLAESIEADGLLHLPVVTPTNRLVAGARRLEALKLLGKGEVEVHVISELEGAMALMLAERAENVCRKDFTPTEAIALGMELEKLERTKAATRVGGRPRKEEGEKTGGKLPLVYGGKTRDKVGKAVGMAGRSFEKGKQVVQAAQESPALYGELLELMDDPEKGSIDAAHKKLKEKQNAQKRKRAAASSPPLKGKIVRHGDFRISLADLKDGSVRLIFTDPPYGADSIPLYGDLATLAARLLAPGGSLVCYCGQYALPQVLPLITPLLSYRWCFAVKHGGGNRRQHGWRVRVAWKPLLWFAKLGGQPTENYLLDLLDSEPGDKSLHQWAQGCAEAAYLINHLTVPGELVVDPMCGSGTTLTTAVSLGRRAIGVDCDLEQAKIAAAACASASKNAS